MLAPYPALESLLRLILAPARTPRHHSRKPMRVVISSQQSYRVNPTFGHLALCLTFLAALTSPTYSYSQDDFRPLPAERWKVLTTSAAGAPYLSANDYALGDKPVRWQCAANSDGVEYRIKDIKDILVVMAHQPDFPQRMDFFSYINHIHNQSVSDGRTMWMRDLSIPKFISNLGEKRYIYGGSVYGVPHSSIYASLLVYVSAKFNDGDYERYTLTPLVAYYSDKYKSLEDLQYYAPDCAAANLNGITDAYYNLAVVPPLGRADDYPAFRITVPDDGANYIDTWQKVERTLNPWSGALEGELEISRNHTITKLLLHTIISNGRVAVPTVAFDPNSNDSWTYGDLLRHYFDYHDTNGERVNPVFLSGLSFPVIVDGLQSPGGGIKPWFVANTIGAAGSSSNDEEKPSGAESHSLRGKEMNQQSVVKSTTAPPPKTQIEPVKSMILTVEFTGKAFSELGDSDWSHKMQTNGICKVEKLEANTALYQLICRDHATIRENSQLFLGNADSTSDDWWLVKDALNLNTELNPSADNNGSISKIDASEVTVGRVILETITIKTKEPSPNWLKNNGFKYTNLSQIFLNDSYKLSALVNEDFSVAGCTRPVRVKASNIVDRSITIDFSPCQTERNITIAYPTRYQPANPQDMRISTTFSGCAGKSAEHTGKITSETQGWQFSNCFLDTTNDNTFPIQIAITGFEPLDHALTITPQYISRSAQANTITLPELKQEELATKLRPQLVPSAIQPFGPDANPIPGYRLTAVRYRRSTNDNNITCPPYIDVLGDSNNPILPSLSEAGCEDILPTHISYYYERLDPTDSSFPNEAYSLNWRTIYFSLGAIFSYSHDQFKRRALFSSTSLRRQIDFLQSTHLGGQYDENTNLSGTWAYFIHADADCRQPIGLINSATEFMSIDDTDISWPLYAQISHIDNFDQPLSNCAPAQFEAIPEDDRTGMVSFDLFLTIPR